MGAISSEASGRAGVSVCRRKQLAGAARHAAPAITSAFTVAAAAVVVDIYQWSAALPLRVDEETIALNVRDRSLGDLAGTLWPGQSAPFGWLALERVAMATIGTGEAALRAMPLLFGIATVGVAAWVGRRWMGRIAAWCSSCCVGLALARALSFRGQTLHRRYLFGLLLPALAAWANEPDRSSNRARRIWLWWMAAATGHWLANGALLVTPACAIFLSMAMWRRDGLRSAAQFAAGGFIWLASFGLHYLIRPPYGQQHVPANDVEQRIASDISGPTGSIGGSSIVSSHWLSILGATLSGHCSGFRQSRAGPSAPGVLWASS